MDKEQKEETIKIKLTAFFEGTALKKNGVIACNFLARQSNFVALTRLASLQKSDVDLFYRLRERQPQRLGRFVFDKCVLKNGAAQLTFTSVREAVELKEIFSLPLSCEDMGEFDLLCKIYIKE